MNKIILISLLTLISLNIFASAPSLESLFRNGSNGDIKTDSVILKAKIIKEKDLFTEEEVAEPEQPLYLKILINRITKESYELIQLLYTDKSMKNDSLVKLYEGKSFLRYLKYKKENDPERDIFYGLIFSLLENKSEGISAFLNKTNSDFKKSQNIENEELISLYESYKNYLQTIKDEPNLKEELFSPLKPESEEDRKRVKELLNMSFYQNYENIKLIKENNEFYLQAKVEKTRAKFTNKDHKMVEFTFDDLRGVIKYNFYDYVLFNGINEAPRNILITIPSGKYRLSVDSVKFLSFSRRSLAKIRSSYRKAIGKRKKLGNSEQVEGPGFLF